MFAIDSAVCRTMNPIFIHGLVTCVMAWYRIIVNVLFVLRWPCVVDGTLTSENSPVIICISYNAVAECCLSLVQRSIWPYPTPTTTPVTECAVSLYLTQRSSSLFPSATRLWTSPLACRWTTEAWPVGCLATSMGSLETTSFFPMAPLWPLTWPTDRSTKTLDPSVSYFWL